MGERPASSFRTRSEEMSSRPAPPTSSRARADFPVPGSPPKRRRQGRRAGVSSSPSESSHQRKQPVRAGALPRPSPSCSAPRASALPPPRTNARSGGTSPTSAGPDASARRASRRSTVWSRTCSHHPWFPGAPRRSSPAIRARTRGRGGRRGRGREEGAANPEEQPAQAGEEFSTGDVRTRSHGLHPFTLSGTPPARAALLGPKKRPTGGRQETEWNHSRPSVVQFQRASLSVFPALNLGDLEALILIALPVAGLRPLRAARLVTAKVPKPVQVTLSDTRKATTTPPSRRHPDRTRSQGNGTKTRPVSCLGRRGGSGRGSRGGGPEPAEPGQARKGLTVPVRGLLSPLLRLAYPKPSIPGIEGGQLLREDTLRTLADAEPEGPAPRRSPTRSRDGHGGHRPPRGEDSMGLKP